MRRASTARRAGQSPVRREHPEQSHNGLQLEWLVKIGGWYLVVAAVAVAIYPKASRDLLSSLGHSLSELDSVLLRSGKAFRDAITKSDVELIQLARRIYLLNTVLPTLLYYAGASEPSPKFPATISYTIRKGPPKYLTHLLWLVAWCIMGSVFLRVADDVGRVFAVQMFLSGVLTTIVCPLGAGHFCDKVHAVGATAYMADHHVVGYHYFDVQPHYQIAFWSSFVVFIIVIAILKFLDKKYAVPDGETYVSEINPRFTTDRDLALSKLSRGPRLLIFAASLAVMVTENLMFFFFVYGMDSGLPFRNAGFGES